MERLLGIKYDIDDFSIAPDKPYCERIPADTILLRYHQTDDSVTEGKLPLFNISDTVNSNNTDICTIISAHAELDVRKTLWTKVFCAFKLQELKTIYECGELDNTISKISKNYHKLIHVYVDIYEYDTETIELLKEIKDKYGNNIVIMIGPVKSPKVFTEWLTTDCADYIILSSRADNIINYPAGSLIYECDKLRKEYNSKVKIIADCGSSNSYWYVIKALALGADFYMMRGFAQAMQITIDSWISDFQSIFKSALSSTGCGDIREFIGEPELICRPHKC